jgi:beta-glucanase (GH16 family)
VGVSRCPRTATAAIVGILLGFGVLPSAPAQTSRSAGEPKWILVWRDEFDGAAGRGVDTGSWQIDSTDGCSRGNCGWGNNEKEYYSAAAENLALDGLGHLRIVARRAAAGLNCYYGPCRYTSGKITTRGKVAARPGRVEARIKLPAGQGLWPAFWLLGADDPPLPWPDCGELDIMENHGSNLQSTSSAIHGPGYFGNTPFVHATSGHGSFAEDFHTFAVEWDSLRVRFFVDDSLHYTVERGDVERHGRWVFDKPFFMILNLAVGGTFDGDPKSDAILPATMLVDYVRVYERRAPNDGGAELPR